MVAISTPPTFGLNNRRALVTGASSGIGVAAATILALHGAEVCLAARRSERIAALAEALREKGGSARALHLDIADVGATEKTVAAEGPFDILVNSAGAARNVPISEVTVADFDTVMAVNLRGTYFLTRAVGLGLIEAGKPGSLINISSQMGLVGGVDRSVYCASKHGVEGFTKAMAIEFGPHKIRVNTIAPTFIRTALTEPTFRQPDKLRWILDKIKLGRIAEVEDISGAVLYLASDASAMVTGSSLKVDGGWTAG